MKARPNAPCKDCENRWVKDGKTCHGSCEAYNEYRKHLYDVYKEREYNFEASDYTSARCQKIIKRKNMKNKRW